MRPLDTWLQRRGFRLGMGLVVKQTLKHDPTHFNDTDVHSLCHEDKRLHLSQCDIKKGFLKKEK